MDVEMTRKGRKVEEDTSSNAENTSNGRNIVIQIRIES